MQCRYLCCDATSRTLSSCRDAMPRTNHVWLNVTNSIYHVVVTQCHEPMFSWLKSIILTQCYELDNATQCHELHHVWLNVTNSIYHVVMTQSHEPMLSWLFVYHLVATQCHELYHVVVTPRHELDNHLNAMNSNNANHVVVTQCHELYCINQRHKC